MADFNKPDNTSSHVVLWGWVRDMVASCAAILDSRRSADTNVPLYAKRWNNATRRFQEFNGSVWTDIIILGTSIDQATTTVRGTVQLATNAEVTAGTNTEKAVVPSSLKVELDKKALLNGSNTQKFKVAAAVDADEAVRLEQTGGLIDVQIFSTAGVFTWNRPIGTRAIEVFCLGGGGGGGRAATTAAGQVAVAGNGNPGTFAYSFIDSPAASYIVTVGAGGAGAPSGTTASGGSAGGESNFGGTIVRAGGGFGGHGSLLVSTFPSSPTQSNSISGQIGVGQIVVRGAPSSPGIALSPTAVYVPAGGSPIPWLGGPSMLHIGSMVLRSSIQVNGQPAAQPGGGGTGGLRTESQSGDNLGGNGAAGLVMVKSYR